MVFTDIEDAKSKKTLKEMLPHQHYLCLECAEKRSICEIPCPEMHEAKTRMMQKQVARCIG